MITTIKAWFDALSNREQWLVAIAAALASIAIAIYGIALPLSNAIETAEAEHDEAVQRRGRIESKVARVGKQTPPAAAANVDLDALVMQSAIEQGFDVVKGSGAAGTVSIRIEQARAPALFGWVETLSQQGVEVGTISLKRTTSGSVAVDMQVRRRGQ